MLLAKSLYQKLWDDSPYLLKQLPGIGMVTAKVFSTSLYALEETCFLVSLGHSNTDSLLLFFFLIFMLLSGTKFDGS